MDLRLKFSTQSSTRYRQSLRPLTGKTDLNRSRMTQVLHWQIRFVLRLTFILQVVVPSNEVRRAGTAVIRDLPSTATHYLRRLSCDALADANAEGNTRGVEGVRIPFSARQGELYVREVFDSHAECCAGATIGYFKYL